MVEARISNYLDEDLFLIANLPTYPNYFAHIFVYFSCSNKPYTATVPIDIPVFT